MSLFKSKNPAKIAANQSSFAEHALKVIHDGVIMTDRAGIIQFINPAAVTMTECGSYNNALGLDYGLVIKLESKEGRELSENENPLIQAIKTGQPLDGYHASLIAVSSGKHIPVAISVLITDDMQQSRIITMRNITKELEEEGEQAEFISTASHEMRTPVATIDGYLSLALNPQTATIDERARGYLTAAQAASKHLGKLFQDLLDVTKLDDGKIRPHFEPAEMVSVIRALTNDHAVEANESKIKLTFGTASSNTFGNNLHIEQVVYSFIDPNFMREIMDNIIGNAIKYTPEGGSVYVNVRGDGDRVLINVTDTGIGISADDISHIFQKFYRADNSDTRTIGGTGLGLYLVKQRVEAMGGKVWAESAFGEGSTFYVSLPRLTPEEYEKRMIMVRNLEAQKMMMAAQQPALTAPAPQPQPAPQPALAPQPAPQPTPVPQPVPQPAPQPTVAPPGPPAPPQPQIVNQNINNNLNGEQQ